MNRSTKYKRFLTLSEENELAQVAMYIKIKHPNVPTFWTDHSGLKMSRTTAIVAKNTRGILQDDKHTPFRTPDMMMDVARSGYHGLRIEFKKTDERILIVRKGPTRDVAQFNSNHVEEQFRSLHALHKEGYYATFAIGYDEATKVVDDYLNGHITDEIDCVSIYTKLCLDNGLEPDWNYFRTLIV